MTSKGGGKGVGVSLLAQFSFAPRSSKFEDSDSSPEPPAEAVPGPDRRSPGPERSPKRARAGLAVTSTSSNAFAGVTPCSTALAAGVPTAVQREEGQVDAGNGDNAHPSSPSLTAETPNPGTTTGRAAGGDTDADISAKMEPAASDLSRFFGARHGGGNAATVPPVKQEHGRRNPLPGSSAATPAPAADVAAAIACSRDPDTRRKLREYDLIRQWRVSNKQTVDDFHNFLCELRDVNGRYWALIACLLSVQCRDVVALSVARKFMAKYPAGATAVVALSEADVEASVRRCNFYKTKAKNVVACTAAMLKLHGGTAPSSYASLVALPGVGPKIAHLMRSVTFGTDGTGIVVDTHVHRIARLLLWVDADHCTTPTPERTRVQLERWVPAGGWADFTTDVVGFGQATRTGGGWWDRFLRHVAIKHGADSPESDLAAIMVSKIQAEAVAATCTVAAKGKGPK